MRLKKMLVVFGSLGLIASLVITAWAAAPAQKSVPAPKVAPTGEMVKVFTIGMGTSGVGTVQTLSTAWSALISKYGPFKSVVENSPTMMTKSQHITDGTIHSYIFPAQQPIDGYFGTEDVKGRSNRLMDISARKPSKG
jgi:hypothetical protein